MAQDRKLPDRQYGTAPSSNGKNDHEEKHIPEIRELGNGKWEIDIPSEMSKALRTTNRRFEPWDEASFPKAIENTMSSSLGRASYVYSSRQLPWAVVGDFNGDGKTDLVISGRTDRHMLVLMLLSQSGRKFSVLEIDREPFDDSRRDRQQTKADPVVLSYVYPGKYQTLPREHRSKSRSTVEFTTPGVKLEFGYRRDAGVVVYRVEKEELVPYYTIDLTTRVNSTRSGNSKR